MHSHYLTPLLLAEAPFLTALSCKEIPPFAFCPVWENTYTTLS